MRLVMVIALVLLDCREDREEQIGEESAVPVGGEEDAGKDGGSEETDDPECRREYATRVFISATPADGRLGLAKRDETMEVSARLSANAWHRDGDDDPFEADVWFEWEIADESVAFLLPFGTYNHGAMLWGRQDLFDRADGRDPETTVAVCGVNNCRGACGECEERVCSEPLTVVGLPNLEGRWQIVADTLPVPVAVDVRQDGYQIITAVADAEAGVSGDQVRFVFHDQVYTGTIAPSRGLVDGLVAPADDDSVHLTWSAVRLEDL